MSTQTDPKASSTRSARVTDWRVIAALWVMLGGLCVALAHTFAAGFF